MENVLVLICVLCR